MYPVWGEKIYNVSYDSGEGTGPVPEDDNKYFLGAGANVLEPTNLIAPKYEDLNGELKDKVFIGWKSEQDGKIYYPNNKLIITGNMTLTAQWGDIVPDTELTYRANEGVGTEETYTLKNNDTHKVKENMFTRTGYNFTGWNTKADGSGKTFQPEDEIIVGNSEPIPNELYAQWVEVEKIDIPVEKVWSGKELASVTINLILGDDVVDTVILSKNETDLTKNWKDIFKDKLKKDAQGNDYVYTVQEVAVEGYDSVITGTVEDGFTVTNTQVVGSLEITKADGNGDIIATGAEFELRDQDGNSLDPIIRGTTGADGKYKFEDLPFGDYQLVETKAPLDENGKPYRLLTKPIDITIDGEVEKTVKNYKSGWTLPSTGGIGTIIFYGLGIVLMLLAGYMLIRKKVDRQKN